MEKNAITTKKLNPWLEHVKAYKLEHPEVSLKSVLTEARKTYKTVKTVKQDTRKNAPKVTKARRQVVKKNLDNPDEQQLLKVLQNYVAPKKTTASTARRLELDQQQTPASNKKKNISSTNSKKTRISSTNSKKKNIEDYTDSNEIIDM
jgi:hypothetical protein